MQPAFQTVIRVHHVIDRLLNLGILAAALPGFRTVSETDSSRRDNGAQPRSRPSDARLTAPETVHWAITYRCNQRCPDCYARRHSTDFSDELGTDAAIQMVDKLARWEVFQLAIGGGEPFLRTDLTSICEHAHQQGLTAHVTTGYHSLRNEMLQTLRESVSVIQIGVKHDKLLTDPTRERAKLSETVRGARDMGIGIGANLMMSSNVMAHFDRLIELLAQSGVSRMTLLRYKPPADQFRWRSENPLPEVWRDFERRLPDVLNHYHDVAFRIDCALSFLQRGLAPDDAASAGIRGCVAGDRILALTPDGRVFPCSQLVGPDTVCGSILTDEPEDIWMYSDVMRRYRAFRESGGFKESRCEACSAKVHCGGCRVFAEDRLGADPYCPRSISSGGDH